MVKRSWTVDRNGRAWTITVLSIAEAEEEDARLRLVVRQPSIDGSWRSFTPLAALLLLDVDPATPASERLASDAKSSPLPLSIEG
jgi:hypothetical protein